MTLHPIPSEFPYIIWGKFCFLFYQCAVSCFPMSKRQSRCIQGGDLLSLVQNRTFSLEQVSRVPG
jgi:hypothetical protein